MATTSSTFSVSRPRFGRRRVPLAACPPVPAQLIDARAHFARDDLTDNTRVEAPYISARIRKELETIQAAAGRDHLALTTHLAFPKLNDTFWVNLISRGIARRKRLLPGVGYAIIMPTESKTK